VTGFKHGLCYTPTYRVWMRMKCRCNWKKGPKYSLYGGREIGYDPRWETYLPFLTDMGERPLGLSLDRVDNNRGYSKENCRWATSSQQNLNRRPHKLHKDRNDALCHPDRPHFAYNMCNMCYSRMYRKRKRNQEVSP
jgi:hypothetical protein